MSNETLHLSIPTSTGSHNNNSLKNCTIHPVVVLEVLDHFVRAEDQDRVYGTLLGVSIDDSTIEIRSSYPVPFTTTEEGSVELNIEFHRRIYQNKLKTNPQELIVGWYSLGSQIDNNSINIHDFFWKEIGSSPVHILLDPYNITESNNLGMKGFTAQSIGVGSEKFGFVFQSIHLSLGSTLENFSKLGLDILYSQPLLPSSTSLPKTLIKDLDSLEISIQKLYDLIQSAESYVQNVLEGKIKEDIKAGRMLWEAVSDLPRVDRGVLEKGWNNSITDLLMVVYLANLTKTQILTTEKLYQLPTLKQGGKEQSEESSGNKKK